MRALREARPWTPQDEDLLRELMAQEHSRRDIARRLGRTQGAVDARLGKLGLLVSRKRQTA